MITKNGINQSIFYKLDKRIIKDNLINTLEKTGDSISSLAIAEMAIPSYLYGNALSRWFAWRKVEKIIEMCGDLRNANIMDFGCGTGILFNYLQQGSQVLYGVDIELEFAKEMANQLNMKQTKFFHPDKIDNIIPDSSLDIVIAANVLEHVPSLSWCLELFWKKLKEGGFIIISGPTENKIYRTGRTLLRLLGHKEFTGEYHETDINQIFNSANKLNFIEIKKIKIPNIINPIALYWIGKFVKKGK